jgi:hypothetical protein
MACAIATLFSDIIIIFIVPLLFICVFASLFHNNITLHGWDSLNNFPGKSELGRRLASISGGGAFFERLLTKYSNPEELFGPLSLTALEKDEYIRKTAGYLPTASVAFLDEIFKANSAILNSLLTILNERRFDNGNERVAVPLLAVVAASNELPDSEELDALYDRFLFRRQVMPVSDGAIAELLTATPKQVIRLMSLNDIKILIILHIIFLFGCRLYRCSYYSYDIPYLFA